jgi:hypothetical protein
VIGALSIALAGYELYASVRRRRTLSHVRGMLRAGVVAWWLILGAHFAYEWIADDLGRAAAEALS